MSTPSMHKCLSDYTFLMISLPQIQYIEERNQQLRLEILPEQQSPAFALLRFNEAKVQQLKDRRQDLIHRGSILMAELVRLAVFTLMKLEMARSLLKC